MNTAAETRTLIVGSDVVGGSGGERFRPDVLVSGDPPMRVAPDISRGEADVVVDAGGLVVAPGFIDLHTPYGQVLLTE